MSWSYLPRRMPVVGVLAEGGDPSQFQLEQVLQGKNFVEPGQPPFKSGQNHGTNCAYILSEIVHHQVRFRFYRCVDNFIGTVDWIKAAIEQGVADEVDFFIQMYIISPQWSDYGNGSKMTELRNAIANSGKLFISVSGNLPGNDLDINPQYPPQFVHEGVDNMITVAGTDQQDQVFTNYGDETVHIAAPGKDIPMRTGGTDSGSSYAVPQIGALAAQCLALEPDMSTQALLVHVLTYSEDYSLPVMSGRMLTAYYPPAEAEEPPQQEGNAWGFDGTQYVQYSQVVQGWPEMTLRAIFKLDSASGTRDVVSQWSYPSGREWLLAARVNSNGKSHFEVGSTYVQGPQLVAGTHTLIARVGSGQLSLKVNGQEFTTPFSGAISNFNQPLVLGSQVGGSNSLIGSIQEISIWNSLVADDADVATAVWSRICDGNQPDGQVVNGPLNIVQW